MIFMLYFESNIVSLSGRRYGNVRNTGLQNVCVQYQYQYLSCIAPYTASKAKLRALVLDASVLTITPTRPSMTALVRSPKQIL